ncbi:MAG: SpoIIE family protein phosphatase [Bacteroidia bacterium]|nr:SpoIIE family protein phosphatase [Bacteroidia bacterium]
MYNRIRTYFIGHRLDSTEDVFEKAKIKLVFDFTFFMSVLAIPFVIQLGMNGYWYHFAINIFEITTLSLIYVLFRSNLPLRHIGITFIIMDCIMSAGSLIFQNGYFELQAGLWSLLLVIYSFFVMGKTWGSVLALFVALLYGGCIPAENGVSLLNFGLPENQILPTASVFIIFPFLLNIYIVTAFINAKATAESLIRNQKKLLETQKEEIISSITYARRIQQAKLPAREDIHRHIRDSFILFKPKDIVSGDFYFFSVKGSSVFLAAADCTGHGVPGALMSMICSEKLEDAIAKCSGPSAILEYLNRAIRATLKQTDDDHATRDGMDIALCEIDFANRKVRYAGANRPLWIIRGQSTAASAGSLTPEVIPATKKAIGGFTDNHQPFDTHDIQLYPGDSFYVFTDGYADTFNGKSGKKLTARKFKDLLMSVREKSMPDQEKHLDEFIENWMAGVEAIDDILVIGVRL